MEPERIEIDPRELEALQRAQEQLEAVDEDPSPEVDANAEVPAAAEQPDAAAPEAPDFTQEVAAPDLGELPDFDDEEEADGPLDAIPDLPAAPIPKALNAWQKRHGQVEAPAQHMPRVPEEDGPPEQKAQPVAPPDFEEVADIARQLGAMEEGDDKEQLVDWRAKINDDNGEDAGNNGKENPGEAALRDAMKGGADRIATIVSLLVENLQLLAGRLDRAESQLRELRNGQARRR